MSSAINHSHRSSRNTHSNKANFQGMVRRKRTREMSYRNPSLMLRLMNTRNKTNTDSVVVNDVELAPAAE